MEENFELEHGDITFREVKGDSGRVKRCGFCAKCGSRIYHCGSAGSDVEGGIVYSIKVDVVGSRDTGNLEALHRADPLPG